MFRHILVPIDRSTFSEHAISYATKIAAAADAKLEFALVHVVYQPAFAEISVSRSDRAGEREQRHREAEYLRELTRRVAAATGRAIDPILLSGDVAPVREHQIEERGVDLVVMTTHGRAGLERAWLGSVAGALIRHVDQPVLLIRPKDGEPSDADGTVPRFEHVLMHCPPFFFPVSLLACDCSSGRNRAASQP